VVDKYFCDEFDKGVDQTNGYIVSNAYDILLLWHKSDIGRIKFLKAAKFSTTNS
jgi:hypothetical protein